MSLLIVISSTENNIILQNNKRAQLTSSCDIQVFKSLRGFNLIEIQATNAIDSSNQSRYINNKWF